MCLTQWRMAGCNGSRCDGLGKVDGLSGVGCSTGIVGSLLVSISRPSAWQKYTLTMRQFGFPVTYFN